jgi:hypothetical protein
MPSGRRVKRSLETHSPSRQTLQMPLGSESAEMSARPASEKCSVAPQVAHGLIEPRARAVEQPESQDDAATAGAKR